MITKENGDKLSHVELAAIAQVIASRYRNQVFFSSRSFTSIMTQSLSDAFNQLGLTVPDSSLWKRSGRIHTVRKSNKYEWHYCVNFPTSDFPEGVSLTVQFWVHRNTSGYSNGIPPKKHYTILCSVTYIKSAGKTTALVGSDLGTIDWTRSNKEACNQMLSHYVPAIVSPLI